MQCEQRSVRCFQEAKAEQKKYLPCYWIPSLTPEAGPPKILTKPSTHTVCPEGKHVIRLGSCLPRLC